MLAYVSIPAYLYRSIYGVLALSMPFQRLDVLYWYMYAPTDCIFYIEVCARLECWPVVSHGGLLAPWRGWRVRLAVGAAGTESAAPLAPLIVRWLVTWGVRGICGSLGKRGNPETKFYIKRRIKALQCKIKFKKSKKTKKA